jgi:predicted Zn-dependent peptidase
VKEDITETRLDNGLVVLTDRMPGVRSATLGFFFRVGARHEPEGLHGISHFIEHTVFKGTAKRTALDIAIEQDRLGGNLDAFTTHEEIGFAIKVIDDQLPTAFDLIADMLANPRFDEADLSSEQKVIIEEMKMVDDSPEESLGDLFSEMFFAEHPLGRNIAGTPESVKTFNHEKTRTYHAQTFTPANLVIVAAGNVEHEAIVELSTTWFSAPADITASRDARPPDAAAPIVVKHRPDLEQAHLILATPFPGATDDRRYAADLTANIIGGGTSSRLWQKVREERGLAYSVGASATMYQDCGLFAVSAATSPEQTREVVDLAIDEMKNVVRDGVTDDELELVKAQARASILLSLEDSAARAAALAQSEMVYGRQISVEETLSNIDAVTVEDCQAIATEFFKTDVVAFAALGDLDDLTITRDDLAI